jgi:hypothetical protein
MRPAETHEYCGSRCKLDDHMADVRALLRNGATDVRIARELNVSPKTVSRFIRENRLARPIIAIGGTYVERKPVPSPSIPVHPFEPVAEGAEHVVTLRVVDCIAGGAAWLGIPVPDFISQARHRKLVRPRQFAMYLARKLTQASLPRIGSQFGGRDHTTVLHAQKFVTKALAADPAAATFLSQIHRYAAAHALLRAAKDSVQIRAQEFLRVV